MVAPNPESVKRAPLLAYFGFAFVALNLAIPSGGVASLPLLVLLKDVRHLGPEAVSTFKLVVAIPTYVSFAFGFIRDRWSPLARGDQGYLLVFGLLAALAYATLAFGSLDLPRVLASLLIATAAFRFLSATLQGLLAEVGKRYGMTGGLSALFNIVFQALAGLSAFTGGWLTQHLEKRHIYGLLAAITLLFVVLALVMPRGVRDAEPTRSGSREKGALKRDLLATLAHRPLWPAVAIWLLWQFVPGFGTAFAYFFTDRLHGTPEGLGTFFSIFALVQIPVLGAYAWLSKRVAFRKLLLGSLFLAVPQMIPLLVLNRAEQAIALAIPIGIMGGLASGAVYDLILRASPRGCEGTATMIADAGLFIAMRFGDLFGARIYSTSGFAATAWITTAVYALMIPLAWWSRRTYERSSDLDSPALS